MFNGYDPKSVDEVIEQITEDYAAMQKTAPPKKPKTIRACRRFSAAGCCVGWEWP